MRNKWVIVMLLPIALQANADVSEEEKFTFEIDPNGRFSLENVNGDIRINGVRGNTIEVIAYKKAANEKALKRIEIDVDADENSVSIETTLQSGKRLWFGIGDEASVDYTVTLPESVDLDAIESVNGDVFVDGVKADVTIDTVNGDIEIRGLANDATLETVNGDIEATFVNFGGKQRADCDTVNGAIVVSLPEDADATVSAESLNGAMRGGDFELEVEKGRFIGSDMRGKIGKGSARLNLATVNGGIKIARD